MFTKTFSQFSINKKYFHEEYIKQEHINIKILFAS